MKLTFNLTLSRYTYASHLEGSYHHPILWIRWALVNYVTNIITKCHSAFFAVHKHRIPVAFTERIRVISSVVFCSSFRHSVVAWITIPDPAKTRSLSAVLGIQVDVDVKNRVGQSANKVRSHVRSGWHRHLEGYA